MISRSEIKLIKSLKLKKYRIVNKLFLLEGLKCINEVLNSDYKIRKIILTKSSKNKLKSYSSSKVKIDYFDKKSLSSIGNLKSNSDAIAIVEMKDNLRKIKFYNYTVILDGIRDPGNLGTIIRTCDWYGIKNIVCSKDSVDLYNPKVIQSSMGSFSRVNVFYRDLEEFFTENDLFVYGTILNSKDYHEIKFNKKGVLLFGNESKGVSSNLYKYINKKISIYGNGKAESLNLAISSALILDKVKKLIK